ncbi:predicted protein, partial [Nematostella vectensis]
YSQGYAIYLKFSQHHQRCKDIIQQEIPRVVSRILPALSASQRLSILSIGAGDGKMDREVINAALKALPEAFMIANTAVEPNANELAVYKEAIARAQAQYSLGNHRVEWRMECQTFNTFLQRSSESTAFDLVHFIYSIYYMDDLEVALRQCYERMLRDTGAILVVLRTPEDLISQLASCFASVGIQAAKGTEDLRDTHVIEIARKLGWVYERRILPFTIDVTDLYDALSIDGNMLLDFLTHFVDFRKTAGPELMRDVLQFIKDN